MKTDIAIIILAAIAMVGCDQTVPPFNPQRIDDGEQTQKTELLEEADEPLSIDIDPEKDWNLFWADEFDYPDSQLETNWTVQNSDQNPAILCGRWRENCLVSNGTLKLTNRGPKQGYPSPYTSGNVWTRDQFEYGYFECRYKYANAYATNNSFWLMTTATPPEGMQRFEIDINEGHYPEEIATNIHNHSVSGLPSQSQSFRMKAKNAYQVRLKKALITNKIRLSSNNPTKFHLPEIRAFAFNSNGYPADVLSDKIDNTTNFATSATVTSSGCYDSTYKAEQAVDGKVGTAHWVTQEEGEKWIELSWSSSKAIGCIQFVNGYASGEFWTGLISDWKLEYWDGKEWQEIKSTDLGGDNSFANEYHTYGCEWNKDEIIYYFDRHVIRRAKNEFCHMKTNIWLSEAIVTWAGPVVESDLLDSFMEVDYVRVYHNK